MAIDTIRSESYKFILKSLPHVCAHKCAHAIQTIRVWNLPLVENDSEYKQILCKVTKHVFCLGLRFDCNIFFSMANNNKRIQLAEWRQFKCFVSFDRKKNPFQADDWCTWSLVVERKPLEPKMDCLKHRKINQTKFFCLEMRVKWAKSIDFASLVQSLDWDVANNSNIGDAFKSKSLEFHVISPYHTSDSIIIYQWQPKPHSNWIEWWSLKLMQIYLMLNQRFTKQRQNKPFIQSYCLQIFVRNQKKKIRVW